MQGNQESFEDLRRRSEEYYRGLRPTKCPALLNEEVHYTSDGFHHLRYDGSRSERSKDEQRRKLKLLRRAVEVICKTTTVQEYRTGIVRVGQPDRHGMKKIAKAQYWAFIAIIDTDCRLRAIVRRVGDGKLHFWSVMPDWQVVEAAPGQKTKRMCSVDLSEV